MGHARKERVVLFGTDQRITSGPAAKRPHSKAEYMTAPERFADSQIPLAPRAPSIHDPRDTLGLARNRFLVEPEGWGLTRLERSARRIQFQRPWDARDDLHQIEMNRPPFTRARNSSVFPCLGPLDRHLGFLK